MSNSVGKTQWYCVSCGHVLGHVVGGEFQPAVGGECLMTRGPNLAVTCPECGTVKTFYTADPIVRAVYQFVDAIVTVMTRRLLANLSEATVQKTTEHKPD